MTDKMNRAYQSMADDGERFQPQPDFSIGMLSAIPRELIANFYASAKDCPSGAYNEKASVSHNSERAER